MRGLGITERGRDGCRCGMWLFECEGKPGLLRYIEWFRTWKRRVENTVAPHTFRIKNYNSKVTRRGGFSKRVFHIFTSRKSFAFSKRKLCNDENFRVKDFDEFRCF